MSRPSLPASTGTRFHAGRAILKLAAGDLEADLSVEVRHPLEVLLTDIGIPALVAAQTHSLEEFRPACYYGCQIVRPFGALTAPGPAWPP